MNIVRSIGRIFQGRSGQIISKAVGATALGFAVHDANHIGKVQADFYASEKDAKATAHYTNNMLYSTNMSSFSEGVKKAAFRMQVDQGWRRFINLGIGYLQGFGSMLVEQVVPIGLGLGALLSKGKTSKIAAGALAIYGGIQFIRDFFGVGTPKPPIN